MDMRKALKILLWIILVAVLCVLLYKTGMYICYAPPAGERTSNATSVPEVDGEVSGVRISYIPRTQKVYKADEDGAVEYGWIQLLLGYNIDGIWCDIPMENYELCILADYEREISQSPTSAISDDHIIRVGQYAVVCVFARGDDGIPYDTIGTVPLRPLLELTEQETEHKQYGLVVDHRERLLTFTEPAYSITFGIGDRYYFVLNLDELPEDYELHYYDIKWGTSDPGLYGEYILTDNDIRNLLGWKGAK